MRLPASLAHVFRAIQLRRARNRFVFDCLLLLSPIPFLFMVLGVFPDLRCGNDSEAPSCLIESYSLKGSPQYCGAVLFIPQISTDNCSKATHISYYLLGEGREIKENDTLPCGLHTIQTMVTDDAGNINVCEFQVYVNCAEWGEGAATSDYYINGRKILVENIENKESFPDFVRLGVGSLSAIWESGKRGAGAISNGKGDPGGGSYGIYQLSLKKGYVDRFLENEGKLYSTLLGDYKVGSKMFNKMWQTVAEIDPTGFAEAQHNFIRRTHYIKRPIMQMYDISRERQTQSMSSPFSNLTIIRSIKFFKYTSLILL